MPGIIITTSELINNGSVQAGFQAQRRASGQGPQISGSVTFNSAVGELFNVRPLGKDYHKENPEDFNFIDYEA